MTPRADCWPLLAFSTGTESRQRDMGLPRPLCPSWHPLQQSLCVWGLHRSPLTHSSLSPAPPHNSLALSGDRLVPAQPQGLQRPLPQPCPAQPGSGDLLSVPCSRLGWVFGWKEGCSGETEILALGSTSRGSRCTGDGREGRAGGHYLVPSSGLPSPSVFPSSSVF